MLSILELQLLALKQQQKKKRKHNKIADFSYQEDTHSRSRNKNRKTKTKTQKIKHNIIASPKLQKETVSDAKPLQQNTNKTQQEQLRLNFLEQKWYPTDFLRLECAKLVQANTILTAIIKEQSFQKYYLQQKILQKLQQIKKHEQKLIAKQNNNLHSSE